MKKKVLVSLVAVGLLFSCVSAQVDAQVSCAHQNTTTVIIRTVAGGYYHTYIAPGGKTKECAVTEGTYTYEITCNDCGEDIGPVIIPFSEHSTNHD